MTMKKLPNLRLLLEYKNPLVVERFKQNFPGFSASAEQLFTDMLKYLWLSVKHEYDLKANPGNPELQFIPVMHEEMRPIDNMWHEFILITLDYHEFCNHYFGEYLHHVPNMREKLQFTEEDFTNQLELFLNYIYEQLGEETLTRWFNEHLEEGILSDVA
ncbi:hypothetical protein ACTAZI_15890 [Legionella bozemanae]